MHKGIEIEVSAIDRRAKTAAAIEAAETDVAAARDALGEAYRERRRAMEKDRRERIVLDEVGSPTCPNRISRHVPLPPSRVKAIMQRRAPTTL